MKIKCQSEKTFRWVKQATVLTISSVLYDALHKQTLTTMHTLNVEFL